MININFIRFPINMNFLYQFQAALLTRWSCHMSLGAGPYQRSIGVMLQSQRCNHGCLRRSRSGHTRMSNTGNCYHQGKAKQTKNTRISNEFVGKNKLKWQFLSIQMFFSALSPTLFQQFQWHRWNCSSLNTKSRNPHASSLLKKGKYGKIEKQYQRNSEWAFV